MARILGLKGEERVLGTHDNEEEVSLKAITFIGRAQVEEQVVQCIRSWAGAFWLILTQNPFESKEN